jgi:hypothetical protein
MLLHLLLAEKLRAQRCFLTVRLCLPKGLAQALPDVKELPVRLPSVQTDRLLSLRREIVCARDAIVSANEI